jgi:hypothetical protein
MKVNFVSKLGLESTTPSYLKQHDYTYFAPIMSLLTGQLRVYSRPSLIASTEYPIKQKELRGWQIIRMNVYTSKRRQDETQE